MKKIKILSQPTQIATIQLDNIAYKTADNIKEKGTKLQIRKWRKLRHHSV